MPSGGQNVHFCTYMTKSGGTICSVSPLQILGQTCPPCPSPVLYAHGCTPISKVAFRDVPLLIRIFGRLALICSQPDMVSFLNLQTGARKSAYTPSVTIRKKTNKFFSTNSVQGSSFKVIPISQKRNPFALTINLISITAKPIICRLKVVRKWRLLRCNSFNSSYVSQTQTTLRSLECHH